MLEDIMRVPRRAIVAQSSRYRNFNLRRVGRNPGPFRFASLVSIARRSWCSISRIARAHNLLSGLWKMWNFLCLLSCLGRVAAPLCTSVLAWPTSDAKVCHCFSLVPTQQSVERVRVLFSLEESPAHYRCAHPLHAQRWCGSLNGSVLKR